MSLLNKAGLLKLIQSGKGFTMDDIANEFRVILKELSNQELNEHLGHKKTKFHLTQTIVMDMALRL